MLEVWTMYSERVELIGKEREVDVFFPYAARWVRVRRITDGQESWWRPEALRVKDGDRAALERAIAALPLMDRDGNLI